jgi:VIT1/CCC1 family predicted Fe2+/Mn2+ transporter
MINEEYGLALNGPSPVRAATVTFAAFVLLGALPLMPFIIDYLSPGGLWSPYLTSSFLSGLAFFLVGAIKGRFVLQKWYWAGMETLMVGGVAAALAYFVGIALRSVVT